MAPLCLPCQPSPPLQVLYFIGVQTHLLPEYARVLLVKQEALYDSPALLAENADVELGAAAVTGEGAGTGPPAAVRPPIIRAVVPDLSADLGPASAVLPRDGTTGGLLALLNSASAAMLEADV